MVAPAPVDPQALAQMQAAREAAEKKAGEFKASLQKSINQELQSAEAQADAHMRSAGIDVDAVKARAAKSASFDFLEPAELNLPKEPQAYAAALKAHIEKRSEEHTSELQSLMRISN